MCATTDSMARAQLMCLFVQAVDKGKEMASSVKETTEEISDSEIGLDEAADKVKDTAKEVYQTAESKNQSEE